MLHLSLFLIKHLAMKADRGLEIEFLAVLSFVADGGE
jgi:hypothetical protein